LGWILNIDFIAKKGKKKKQWVWKLTSYFLLLFLFLNSPCGDCGSFLSTLIESNHAFLFLRWSCVGWEESFQFAPEWFFPNQKVPFNAAKKNNDKSVRGSSQEEDLIQTHSASSFPSPRSTISRAPNSSNFFSMFLPTAW
jgi:hypothetical protein